MKNREDITKAKRRAIFNDDEIQLSLDKNSLVEFRNNRLQKEDEEAQKVIDQLLKKEMTGALSFEDRATAIGKLNKIGKMALYHIGRMIIDTEKLIQENKTGTSYKSIYEFYMDYSNTLGFDSYKSFARIMRIAEAISESAFKKLGIVKADYLTRFYNTPVMRKIEKNLEKLSGLKFPEEFIEEVDKYTTSPEEKEREKEEEKEREKEILASHPISIKMQPTIIEKKEEIINSLVNAQDEKDIRKSLEKYEDTKDRELVFTFKNKTEKEKFQLALDKFLPKIKMEMEKIVLPSEK